jgi:hypothetical protein
MPRVLKAGSCWTSASSRRWTTSRGSPYVPAFDAHPSAKAGWFDASRDDRTVADARFHAAGDAREE